MPEDPKGSSDFKVVDRRTFSEDGKRREDAQAEDRGGEAAATPPRPSENRAAAEREFADEFVDTGPTGFDTLVSYLSTTAMFQLGLLPGPGGERIPSDLMNARRTIDLLQILEEKTQGNLTSDEAKMLDEVLYELRLTFVEVQKRAAPKTK